MHVIICFFFEFTMISFSLGHYKSCRRISEMANGLEKAPRQHQNDYIVDASNHCTPDLLIRFNTKRSHVHNSRC